MLTHSRRLAELHEENLTEWSDIQGHLDTFVKMAATAEKVIELGTRGGASTIAWLYGLAGHGHLWSVDIDPRPDRIPELEHWTFVQGDDCSPQVLEQLPGDVDVVFIDTSHAYEHTLRELRIYSHAVRPGGRILLHDTELEFPDFIGPSIPFPVRHAIETFCAETGWRWTNRPHSYGLGIVEVP